MNKTESTEVPSVWEMLKEGFVDILSTYRKSFSQGKDILLSRVEEREIECQMKKCSESSVGEHSVPDKKSPGTRQIQLCRSHWIGVGIIRLLVPAIGYGILLSIPFVFFWVASSMS